MIYHTKLRSVFIVLFTVILYSCGTDSCVTKVKKEISIEVYSAKNLVESENSELPSLLKSLLEPIDMDSIGYIPTITFKRVDMDKNNFEVIEIPTNEIGEFQKSLSTYSFNDYVSDYSDSELSSSKLLSTPPSKQDVFLPTTDFIFFEDSTKITNSNEFGNIRFLRRALIDKLSKKADLKKITIAIGQPKIGTAQECAQPTSDLRTYVGQGDWDKASIAAQQLSVFNCNLEYMCDSLVNVGNENFTRIKQLQDVGMIDIPMGYYAVAYQLALPEKRMTIKAKYDECLKYFEKQGGRTLKLPSIPN